jgi:hypothetical protein
MLQTFLCFSCLLIADQPPPSVSLQPAPSPPPVKEAPKPATPARIIVGSQVQAADFTILGGFWRHPPRLNHAAYLAIVDAVQKNPDAICVRGNLIVASPDDQADVEDARSRRVEHIIWMIEHHPEWDGFSSPNVSPQWKAPLDNTELRVDDAWHRQAGSDQRNAMIFHNAAMHFAGRDPEYAVSLLKRAIALDPSEKLYVERLGFVYASVDRNATFKENLSPPRPEFVEEVRAALDNSADPYLLEGAREFYRFHWPPGRVPRNRPFLRESDIPSHSRRFRSACDLQ